MPEPPRPARNGFHDETHAAEHLCDHVLTRPEAHDWSLLLPGYRDHLDPADDEALHAAALSLFTGPARPAARSLLCAYVAAALGATADALRLGWWWEERDRGDRCFVGVGLNGVLVVWDASVVRTAYVPRSSTLPPTNPRQPRAVNPLPRRDHSRRVAAPAPITPRTGYEIFQAIHYCASQLYAAAYHNRRVSAAGGRAFVTRCPRQGRWQQWVSTSPATNAHE